MEPFLRQVARHYQAEPGIEHRCFIFPNRRALSFFRKYLADEVSVHRDAPILSPAMYTMNDFFYRMVGARKTDRVHLLLELHKCYAPLRQKEEGLDEFIFWGDVLLSDFDDVDKYLVNASHLFTNVADFKSIQDSYSYLTPSQIDAIERFLGHFRNSNGLTVNIGSEDSSYKAKFLQIWDILLDLYNSFKEKLESQSLCYEGMVYRKLAERLDSESAADILAEVFPGVDSYVFVGLNALNECEKKLMRKLRDAGLGQFCWDYSSEAIKDSHNKSSVFMASNVSDFPQAFDIDPDGLPTPEFNVISVPSGTGMAKQIPQILHRSSPVPGIETAIVLPDETLLIPALNSIPEEIHDLNVTMGYPMSSSAVWSLMNDIASLQMHLRDIGGQWHFYNRQVRAILSSSIIRTIMTPEGAEIASSICSGAKYYIPQSDLSGDRLMECIFRPIAIKAENSPELIQSIGRYQQEVISAIAERLKDHEDMAMELDFAKSYFLDVARLMTHSLDLLPANYFRLLAQIAAGESVPFQGEPLRGLQIMGPLETRALDFDNLIILSCNEGTFPRRSVSSSFIPPELRKGFGLPTYEFQDAVWAYYFYRMIQRASKVWMLFDSRTEGVRSGEQSRYIRQLELHFGVKVNHYVVKSPISHSEESMSIPKTQEHIDLLHTRRLSASALQNYLSCPAKFYYHTVCKLKEEEEASESLDAGMLGNVFHKTMQELYTGPDRISRSYIESLLAQKSEKIRDTVSFHIKDQLHSIEVTGRNIIFEDVVCSYVRKALQRDLELMQSYGTESFRILGLERDDLGCTIGGYRFMGIIDRLDSFRDGEVRVVDYKTGKVTDEDFLIDEDNAESVVEALFGDDNSKRPKIALQLYLYDRLIQGRREFAGQSIVNSIYQTARLFVEPVRNVALNERFCTLMHDRVGQLLEEISDTGRDWERRCDERTCQYCDFKMICGR